MFDLQGAFRRFIEMRRENGEEFAYLMQRTTAVLVSATVVLVYNTLPALITVLRRDLHFDDAMIAAFSAAEMTGVAVGSVASVGIMRWLSPRRTLRLSIFALLAANLLSATTSVSEVLVGLRLLGGFGATVAIGAAYYIYGLRDAERNMGLNLLGTSVVTFLALAPFSLFELRASTVFVGFSLALIPALLLSRWFPTNYVEAKTPGGPSAPSGGGGPSPRRVLRATVGLAGAAASTLSVGVFWSFLAPIAAHAGAPERTVAMALSVGTGAAFFSAMFVTAAGARLRSPWVLALVTTVGMLCLWVVAHQGAPLAFIAGVAGWYICLPVMGAVALGYGMLHAPYARYAVDISAARRVVLPAAPLLGGVLIGVWGHEALGWTSILMMGAASALLWIYVMISPVRS